MVTYPSRLSRAPAESMEVCYSKTNGKKRKALAAKLEGLPQEDEDDLMGAKRWSKRKRGRPVERPQKSQMKSLKVGEDSECPFLPHVEPVALARDGIRAFHLPVGYTALDRMPKPNEIEKQIAKNPLFEYKLKPNGTHRLKKKSNGFSALFKVIPIEVNESNSLLCLLDIGFVDMDLESSTRCLAQNASDAAAAAKRGDYRVRSHLDKISTRYVPNLLTALASQQPPNFFVSQSTVQSIKCLVDLEKSERSKFHDRRKTKKKCKAGSALYKAAMGKYRNTANIANRQEVCGCPYKPKTGAIYEPARLMVIDNSTNSCAITCESGYQLENRANYAECTNGQKWTGQQRETFTTQALVDNPFLTCIKAMPKTCPPGTWKTFSCTECDPSKIMVTPGAKGDLYAFGSIATSETVTAAAASFNCESTSNNTPDPTGPTTGEIKCGCPYQPKSGAGYDPTKLFIVDGADKKCTLACENGYMLENRANYAECTNGQKWTGQQRETFTTQALVDNPFLTCIKAMPKTCPPGTWKTFSCTECDPSKIMVTPGAKGDLYAFGSIATSETVTAAAASFNCESTSNNTPDPTGPTTGEIKCGCPYQPKSGAGYDPTKLFIVDGADKKCTLACENGYMLENRANYAECTNGQKWTGQQRETFTTQALVDNPFLTCIKAMPKTCPPGTWKTFSCTECDPSKIMVTPGAKGDLYAFGSIATSETVTAAAASFNCESTSNNTPDPTGPTTGEIKCGCPYQPKSGAGYDPTKLFIVDGADKKCTLACENGYMLENRANYAECTNGQKWTGQQRETFTTQALVDNPFLTCIKAMPKTCPPGTWKTFSCTECDPSKIMVTPGAKGDLYAFGSIATSETVTAAAASFNCESTSNNTPDPTGPTTGEIKCGCPYQPKSGAGYDPTKLFIVDGADKKCTLACENGYMLENRANYAECTNGQKWTGQQRETFTTQALVDNPFLTCIKAMPKTCPPGTWKTFSCTECDPSKIMVTPGAKGDLYAFGSIATSETVTAAAASFNCESTSNNTPDPTGPTTGEIKCGCPYQPKSGAGYDPTKLFIVDGADKKCTLACENGYMLENRANYAECTNGQKWTGQQRETFTTQALVDNPFLTCIKAMPKTCPPGTWKTFSCTECDPSKIMVTPGAKGDLYAFGSIATSETVTAAAASFNCESTSNNTPDPTGPTTGEIKCGCPYQPKSGAGYDPTKLFIVDGADKKCTLACENGYMLENRANYVECTNGQKWTGQQRETFTTQALVDNPFLTCIKAMPKTCPPGTWKTFSCTECDPSKIMVTPGAKGDLYAFGSIATSETVTAAAASFNCESTSNNTPDPTGPTTGEIKCGCPYQPKSGAGYDPTKLFIVDGADKKCTLACENGYMLENRANYVECTNGQTWLGQNRETFGIGKLVDNPLLTCVQATAAKTGIMKTFTCANCDPSKIMVTPGTKGECTIMCDRGYRLVGNLVTNITTTLAEATWNDSVWTMYPLGWIQKPTSANAPAVSFNCESI
ncbi:hypothetical protein PRIPAC_78741 [Pristionchus pacificus]|uniref:Uncharacterized protein n=1 Tax=Pristionchus pacificus TaxID=54126 RepID=A0A2A6BI07_PRIPA|nr:hypothetical protein PRIPAC_78741 [Pristionchus pacificus]|eukprot:PDM65507.1 hypothetical protein PRIPAC_52449 [Pristionchus pacificus]